MLSRLKWKDDGDENATGSIILLFFKIWWIFIFLKTHYYAHIQKKIHSLPCRVIKMGALSKTATWLKRISIYLSITKHPRCLSCRRGGEVHSVHKGFTKSKPRGWKSNNKNYILLQIMFSKSHLTQTDIIETQKHLKKQQSALQWKQTFSRMCPPHCMQGGGVIPTTTGRNTACK